MSTVIPQLALSSGSSSFFPRDQDSQIPRPFPPCPRSARGPAFIPGLAVGCGQHPVRGDEGSTAVKASTIEQGHLPGLGVGLALLTFQHLAIVVLCRWERAWGVVRVLFLAPHISLAPCPHYVFFTCASPNFLLIFMHCLLSRFHNLFLFSPERCPCPRPPPFCHRTLGDRGQGRDQRARSPLSLGVETRTMDTVWTGGHSIQSH